MDLTFEESVPVIFYTMFGLTIGIVLVLAKRGRSKPESKTNVKCDKKKSFSRDSVQTGGNCQSSMRFSKKRNRRRRQRVSLLDDREPGSSHQSFILVPSSMAVQYQASISPTPVSRSASCPSVYFSATSLRESVTNFATVWSEKTVKQKDKSNAFLDLNHISSTVAKKEKDLPDKVRELNLDTMKIRSSGFVRPHGVEETCEAQHLQSGSCKKQKGVEVTKKTKTCKKNSDPQQVSINQTDVHDKSGGGTVTEDLDVQTCSYSLSESIDNLDQFHMARPALPTIMAPSGVYVDSFGHVDVCCPPRDELLVQDTTRHTVPQFGLISTGDRETSRMSGRISTKRVENIAPSETFRRSEKLHNKETESFSDGSTSKSISDKSSSNSSRVRLMSAPDRGGTMKNTRKKSKGWVAGREPKCEKPENQAERIQEATREVVCARLPNLSLSVSPSFDSRPALVLSRSSVTDKTTTPNTSSWDSR